MLMDKVSLVKQRFRDWFQRCKSNEFDVLDNKREGQPTWRSYWNKILPQQYIYMLTTYTRTLTHTHTQHTREMSTHTHRRSKLGLVRSHLVIPLFPAGCMLSHEFVCMFSFFVCACVRIACGDSPDSPKFFISIIIVVVVM